MLLGENFMCGIVGYIGKKSVISILLEGLTKLEYRGYDSAGIAVYQNNMIKTYKAEGKLQNLKNLLKDEKANEQNTTIGIGHIRWATHGAPTTINAHPHVSNCGKFAIVHNGIIENFKELKEELQKKGYTFKSDTDTETVVHLITDEYKTTKSLPDAVLSALKKIKGAYALVIISTEAPDTIIAARKNAPLLIGIGEHEHYVASDVPAIIEYTNKAIYLDDDEVAIIKENLLQIINIEGQTINKKTEILPWEPIALSKMGYKHFMLKEIHEQPDIIRQMLWDKLRDIDKLVLLPEVKITHENLKNLNRIQIIACGTSLHAAMVGKYLIEELTEIPTEVEASSEYIYKKNITDKNSLVIGVSQSGETADTITAIRQAKAKGSHILIITNRADSTMARDADSLIPINAGIEVSVAATKSYTAQLLSFYLFALYLAEIKKVVPNSRIAQIKHELIQIPQKIEIILSNTHEIQECAKRFHNSKDFIYIARGINFATALEGALKLKEISYINATGYPAGELKHGPIAMLDNTMPVLSILMPGIVYDKILSNSQEAKARDARMIALTSSDENFGDLFEDIIKIPKTDEILSPLLTSVPLQLIAYYMAAFLGKDVDQPRNLAKSVTVE